MESYARILDFLPNGRPGDRGFYREPVAIAVGETELKLLELIPRTGASVAIGSRMGLLTIPGTVSPIEYVRRRIVFGELTATARAELPPALEEIVRGEPARYLRFFNEAQPTSRRFHMLELVPGIGKKTMRAILEERKRAPFRSFEELSARTHLKNPERLVAARIEQELLGVEDNYHLFVAP